MPKTSFGTSPLVRHIDAQCLIGQTFRHKPTNKRYNAVLEEGGAVELQGIDGRSTYATAEALNDSEVWERVA